MTLEMSTNKKALASVAELQSEPWQEVMEEINKIARPTGLLEYSTYSRIWEYPWVWFHLKPLRRQDIRVLDIGSEKSPFPWFLATQGFDVMVSDKSAHYWRLWHQASRQLKVAVDRRVLDGENLDLTAASVDVYLSVSVLEHVSNKTKLISEAARVLRPGGMLIMTFDICQPEMGMTFPEWNGQAPTMEGFDDLFRRSPWFESGLSHLPWNTQDIPEYISWHRTTASHHNYVTGAALILRNKRLWVETAWKDRVKRFKGQIRTTSFVAMMYLQQGKRVPGRAIARLSESLFKNHR